MSNQEQNTKTSPKPGGAMFGGNAAVPGEKAKNFKNSFGKLLRYMGKFKVLLILVVIFAVGWVIERLQSRMMKKIYCHLL